MNDTSISPGQASTENHSMSTRDEARISVLDNLFLEMADWAFKASAGHSFEKDLDLLAHKFIVQFHENQYQGRFDKSDIKTQINQIFSNDANKAIIENSIKLNTPNNKWRQLRMGKYFKAVNDKPNYYTFAEGNDTLLDVWLKGFKLVKERAIEQLPTQGGASKKRRPLRRKSGTKRLRRRRSNRRSRTSRK